MKKGISLIILVITIIIIIIISSAIILSINNTNIISMANEAKIISDLSNFKEELNLYVLDKKLENPNFSLISLNSSKNRLMYNTKDKLKNGNIKDIMKNISDRYIDKIEIIKGELVINTINGKEAEAARELGIKVNPYDIKDGELLSTEDNLSLMDSNGTITIPDSVTSIGSGAFRKVEGLKTVIIPSSVKKIGDYVFSGNKTLENVIIEEGITEIGAYAFADCTSLKSIHLADSINVIGERCFSNCVLLKEFNFPKNLKIISNAMFNSCYALEKINIPEGIKKLSWYCFAYCNNLKEINIPKSCTYIDGQSFCFTDNLTNINIHAENPNYIFEDGMILSKNKDRLCFILTNKKSLVIPNSVTIIESASINRNTNIKEYYFHENIKSIRSNFSSVVSKIEVNPNNKNYKSINGNLYNYSGENLIKYCSNESNVNLAEGVKRIEWGAFRGQNKIKSIKLPETLEVLDDNAIEIPIKDIYIGKGVKKLGVYAFSSYDVNVTISNENPYYKCEDGISILTKDGKKLHSMSKKVSNYNIPSSVEIIGTRSYRSSNSNIKLSNNIKRIEDNAFYYASSIKKLEIPSSVEYISSNALAECSNLIDVIIDKKENEISGCPWGAPYGLRAIKWKNNIVNK